MGEAIALIGLAAAVLQLIKYATGTVVDLSRFSKTARSASQSLQELKDQLHMSAGLITELEMQHLSSDKSIKDIIIRNKDQVHDAVLLIRKMSIVKGDRKLVKFKKTMRFIRMKKGLEKQLLTIEQQNTILHQYSVQKKIAQQEDQCNRTVDMTICDNKDQPSARALHQWTNNPPIREEILLIMSALAEVMSNSEICLLVEICGERQPSESSLYLAVLITSRVSRILTEHGSHVQARELIETIRGWGSHTLSSNPLVSNKIRRRLAAAERYGSRLHRAERIEYDVLRLQTTLLGELHIETVHSLNNYAIALQSENKFSEAEKAHWMALASKEKMFGPHHLDTLVTVTNLGRCLQALGKHKFAERQFHRALSERRRLLGPNHPAVLRSMSNLGESFCFQGRYEDAEQTHRACLLARMTELGKEDPETIRSKSNLAIALGYQGKSTEAEILYREVVISFDRLGPEKDEAIKASQNLARFLSDQHRYAEAESILRTCTTRAERSLGYSHPRTFGIWLSIAKVLRRQEKYNEGLKFAIRSRNGRIKLFGFQNPDTKNSILCVEQLSVHIRRDPNASHGGL